MHCNQAHPLCGRAVPPLWSEHKNSKGFHLVNILYTVCIIYISVVSKYGLNSLTTWNSRPECRKPAKLFRPSEFARADLCTKIPLRSEFLSLCKATVGWLVGAFSERIRESVVQLRIQLKLHVHKLQLFRKRN